MTLQEQILTILFNSKKGTELPVALSSKPTDLLLLWSSDNNQLESIQKSILSTDIDSWAEVSGDRTLNTLVVTQGDYDDSGNGTKFQISQIGSSIGLTAEAISMTSQLGGVVNIDPFFGSILPGNITNAIIDGFGSGKILVSREWVQANSSDTSEWATFTGTRSGGDLNLILGDYDNSGQGNKIQVDDGGESITVSMSGDLEIVGANIGFQIDDVANTMSVTIGEVAFNLGTSLNIVGGFLNMNENNIQLSDISENLNTIGVNSGNIEITSDAASIILNADTLISIPKTSTGIGEEVSAFVDVSRENISDDITSEVYGLVSRVVNNSSFENKGIIGSNLVGRHSGSGDIEYVYGSITTADYDGSGNVDFIIPDSQRAEISGIGTGTIDYVKGQSSLASIDNPNINVNNLQGSHISVELNEGTVSESQVLLLDFDYNGTGGGNITGDLAYLRIQNDTLPTVTGDSYAIQSLSTLPSLFTGDITAANFIGGGSGLTSLPSNVAYTDSNNNFTTQQTFNSGTANRVATFISTDSNARIGLEDDTTTTTTEIGAIGNTLRHYVNGIEIYRGSSTLHNFRDIQAIFGDIVTITGTTSAVLQMTDEGEALTRTIEYDGNSDEFTFNTEVKVEGRMYADIIQTEGNTVATLPAGSEGQRSYVTDGDSVSFGATVTGGGSTTIPVFYDGTNWIYA